MKLNLSALIGVSALSVMSIGFTACIDDSYDLSDIEPTVQVTVNDLTVPINLGSITLHDVLDLDEGDDIKEMNGEYVVFKEGTFSSNPVQIDKVDIKASPITPSVIDIHNNGEAADVPDGLEIPVGAQTYSYILKEPSLSEFEFSNYDVNYRIKGIDYIEVNWTITFNINVSDPEKIFRQFCLRDVRLQIPEGFVLAETVKDLAVSPTELVIPNIVFSKGVTHYQFDLPVSAIDFKRLIATGVGSFTPGATPKAPGALRINGKLGVKTGEVVAVTNETIVSGSTMELITTPTTTNILINTFSGNIAYDLEDLRVNDVDLSTLPDFLSGDQTNLILSNPQLYINVTNPVGKFGGEPTTGIELVPVRYNDYGQEVLGTPAIPSKELVIGTNKGDGPYLFCLSPARPENYYEGYAAAEQIPYPALSNILSGEGMPKKIRVNFIDPAIDGKVNDFTLGINLPNVEGKYLMYCPLSLGKGSLIVYAKDETGWGEDVRKITIKKLNVTALCHNDLPFDVTFKNCYPLDWRGQRIENVSINEVTVHAGQDQEINIEVTGEFTNFDGIHFEAVASQTSETTLKPGTEIKLTNIRATVTGYYIDKLNKDSFNP